MFIFLLEHRSCVLKTTNQNIVKMFTKKRMEVDVVVEIPKPETVQARFVSDSGEEAGPPLELPTGVTVSQLGRICNAILQNVSGIFDFILDYIFNKVHF